MPNHSLRQLHLSIPCPIYLPSLTATLWFWGWTKNHIHPQPNGWNMLEPENDDFPKRNLLFQSFFWGLHFSFQPLVHLIVLDIFLDYTPQIWKCFHPKSDQFSKANTVFHLNQPLFFKGYVTLLQTDIAPETMPSQKETIVFQLQPSSFSCEHVSFRKCDNTVGGNQTSGN